MTWCCTAPPAAAPRRAAPAADLRPQAASRAAYALRKPRDYAVTDPGALVQLDTLDIRPLPGLNLKQFTARDVVSRWDVIETYTRATSVTATRFLDTLTTRMPFRIAALQVDGGSEFAAMFEEACRQRGFRLPQTQRPRGAGQSHPHRRVLRSYPGAFDLPALRAAQRHWEQIYKEVRPHQASGYLTPAEFLSHHARRGPPSHMY